MGAPRGPAVARLGAKAGRPLRELSGPPKASWAKSRPGLSRVTREGAWRPGGGVAVGAGPGPHQGQRCGRPRRGPCPPRTSPEDRQAGPCGTRRLRLQLLQVHVGPGRPQGSGPRRSQRVSWTEREREAGCSKRPLSRGPPVASCSQPPAVVRARGPPGDVCWAQLGPSCTLAARPAEIPWLQADASVPWGGGGGQRAPLGPPLALRL